MVQGMGGSDPGVRPHVATEGLQKLVVAHTDGDTMAQYRSGQQQTRRKGQNKGGAITREMGAV